MDINNTTSASVLTSKLMFQLKYQCQLPFFQDPCWAILPSWKDTTINKLAKARLRGSFAQLKMMPKEDFQTIPQHWFIRGIEIITSITEIVLQNDQIPPP